MLDNIAGHIERKFMMLTSFFFRSLDLIGGYVYFPVVCLFIFIAALSLYLSKKYPSFNGKLDRYLPLAVIILSLIPRLIMYMGIFYTKRPKLDPSSYVYQLYEALGNNFWEYISFNNVKPPITSMISAPFIWLMSWDFLHAYHFFQLVAYCFEAAACYLLYKAAVFVSKDRITSFLIVMCFSLAITPSDIYWNHGLQHDLYTPFFLAWFIYSVLKLSQDSSYRQIIFTGITAGIVINQQTQSAAIIPIALPAVYLISHYKSGELITIFKKISLMLGIVTLLMSPLVIKNYIAGGGLTVSPHGGPAFMNGALHAYNFSREKMREDLELVEKPDWWMWCYDNAVQPKGKDNKPMQGWDVHAPSFGLCYEWIHWSRRDKCWPMNFEPLIKKFTAMGAHEQVAVLKKDQELMCNPDKHFLFYGHSVELAPRFPGMFGKEAINVVKRLMSLRPDRFLWSFFAKHELFAGYGAMYPDQMAMSITYGQSLLGQNFFRLFTFTFGAFISFVYTCFWIMVLALGSFIVFALCSGKYRAKVAKVKWRTPLSFLVFTSISVGLYSLVGAGVTCCENSRYFMYTVPFLIVLGSYGLSWLARIILKRWL